MKTGKKVTVKRSVKATELHKGTIKTATFKRVSLAKSGTLTVSHDCAPMRSALSPKSAESIRKIDKKHAKVLGRLATR